MRKITRNADAAAQRHADAMQIRPPASLAVTGRSSTVAGRFDGAGLRSRKMLVALLAMLAMLVAGTATVTASDTSGGSTAQSSDDGTSDADVALFSQFRAYVNGATWS